MKFEGNNDFFFSILKNHVQRFNIHPIIKVIILILAYKYYNLRTLFVFDFV